MLVGSQVQLERGLACRSRKYKFDKFPREDGIDPVS
jgi:hypothetical protein